MKRIQERLGLGETELPDERKRPVVREAAENPEALVGAGAPVPPARRRAPDPTHPGIEGASRPGAAARATAPSRANGPSATGTTRMPAGRPQADEPQTTRLTTAKNAVRNAVHNAAAATRAAAGPPAPPAREDREIESWLGELRGTGTPAGQPTPPATARPEGRAKPSAEATRAMPEQGRRPPPPPPAPADEPPTTAIPAQAPDPEDAAPTTAIPAQRPQDPETATDKLNTRGEGDQPKRRGGGTGLSAADLLRREGRY
jgi:RND superfamily putative drug exporter